MFASISETSSKRSFLKFSTNFNKLDLTKKKLIFYQDTTSSTFTSIILLGRLSHLPKAKKKKKQRRISQKQIESKRQYQRLLNSSKKPTGLRDSQSFLQFGRLLNAQRTKVMKVEEKR